jgi:hypothetical protein
MVVSSARKDRRNGSRVDAAPVSTRFPPKELAALDAWIRRQTAILSRPEAVRRLVREALAGPVPKTKAKTPAARAIGDAYARNAAAEQIDRSLRGHGHSDSTKADRKSRLLKAPSNARPKA